MQTIFAKPLLAYTGGIGITFLIGGDVNLPESTGLIIQF